MIEHFAKVTRLAMSALKFKIRLSYAMLIILCEVHTVNDLSADVLAKNFFVLADALGRSAACFAQ